MTTSRFTVGVLAVAALVLVAGPAMAQQTGTLDGTVTDPDGNPLPGVTVTVESDSLLQSRTLVTSADGYFRVVGLPPGDYTLNFQLEGFQQVVREDVQVNVGKVYSINIAMELAGVEETITVTGDRPVVDTGTSKLGGVYDRDLLQNIPTSRDYFDVMKAMPGVNEADPGSADRRTVTVHGSSVRGQSYQVDGVDVSDPVVAYSTVNVSFDQIAEVEVKTGGHPAEVGSADGGVINIVTKSGGNQFSGEAGFFFQNEDLQGNNVEGEQRFEEQDFERGTSLDESSDFSGSLGGPIVRDRVWFFGSARGLRTDNIAIGVDTPVVIDENQYFIKGTGQLNTENQVMFSYNRSERMEPNFGIGRFTEPEATYQRDEVTNTWQAQWNGVFGQNAYADLRIGQSNRDFPLLFQDDADRVFFDLATGVTSGSAFLQRQNDRDRTQANGSLTLFKQDWAGSHEFKAGFEVEQSRFTWDVEAGGPGGVNAFYYNLGGSPFLVGLARAPLQTEEAVDKFGVYAQDSWKVGNLTLNLGVRWDVTEGWNPEQGFEGNQWAGVFPSVDGFFAATSFDEERDVVDWSNVAPRLGGAYDVFGDGQTVVRAFYGRYYNKLIMQFFDFANPNGLGGSLHFWGDTGDFVIQPGELSSPLAVWGGATGGIDPNLDQPYTDEFNVGVEHEVLQNFAIGANLVVKRQRDLLEDVNRGLTIDDFEPLEVTDPGPDGTVGTGDDGTLTVFNQVSGFGEDSFFLVNPEDAFRDYEAVELTFTKRMRDNWQLFGSFVWEDSTGNVGTSFGGSTGRSGDFDNPNQLINNTGNLELEREYQFKMAATYLAPFGINLSGSYRHLSGQPRTRTLQITSGLNQGTITVNAEPRGSSQLDSQDIVDLRVEKFFELGQTGRLGLVFDVFNLTNENSVFNQGFTTPVNFGDIISIIPPRIIRLGARFSF